MGRVYYPDKTSPLTQEQITANLTNEYDFMDIYYDLDNKSTHISNKEPVILVGKPALTNWIKRAVNTNSNLPIFKDDNYGYRYDTNRTQSKGKLNILRGAIENNIISNLLVNEYIQDVINIEWTGVYKADITVKSDRYGILTVGGINL